MGWVKGEELEIDKGYLKEERTGSWEHPKDATPEVSW